METKLLLKEHNLKYTKARAEVLEILHDSSVPLTLEQIKSRLRFPIDQSTLYRCLDVFEKKHLITKTVHLEPSSSVYDFKRHQHKHHLICIRCGTIQVISGCPLGNYEEQIKKETGYTIERHQLELYGLCPKCQAL